MKRLVVVLAVIGLLTIGVWGEETLDVYFLDVGHGDAILIDYENWECLIDAGKGTNSSDTELDSILESTVTDGTIELAILSHNHWDHYGGFADLIGDYELTIAAFWRSEDRNADTEGECWSAFTNAFTSAQFEVEDLGAGDTPLTPLPDDLDWTILAPSVLKTQPEDDNDNANSLVLGLRFDDVSFLFAGDLLEVTHDNITNWHVPSDTLVLKAPHHGRENSATLDLAEILSPALVVVSTADCVPETARGLSLLGIPFLWTSSSGTVRVSTDGASVWVSSRTLNPRLRWLESDVDS